MQTVCILGYNSLMDPRGAPKGGAFLLAESSGCAFAPEDFSPRERQVGECAARFLSEEVLPRTDRLEAGDHGVTAALMRRAGALGLLAVDVPRVYGGLGLGIPAAALAAEKLNFQQSFALTHEAHTVIATLPLLYFGAPSQKSRFLPGLASGERLGAFALSEANSGSDALALRTRAALAADGRGYLLRGMKTWITNSAFADLFTVFARTDDGKVSAFLVERGAPGLSLGPEERKLGQKGTSTRRVVLDDVPVGLENVLPLGTGHYAALCALNLGRFKLEAGAVGGLKELLALCLSYTGQRKAFGRPLFENGLVKAKIADMAARTFALESMVYRLAGDLETLFAPIVADSQEASSKFHRAAEELAIECNIVKVLGSEAYSELADDAIQLHGGYGYTENFAPARAWRDQRLLRIGEGANEVVRVALVGQLLRRDASGRLPLLSADLPPDGAKRLALLLLRHAAARLGAEGLLLAQEVCAPLADLVCSAYALESVALRLQRHPTEGNALLAAGARLWHRERIARAAREALACLGDDPAGETLDRLRQFERAEENPMRLRRALAESLVRI